MGRQQLFQPVPSIDRLRRQNLRRAGARVADDREFPAAFVSKAMRTRAADAAVRIRTGIGSYGAAVGKHGAGPAVQYDFCTAAAVRSFKNLDRKSVV